MRKLVAPLSRRDSTKRLGSLKKEHEKKMCKKKKYVKKSMPRRCGSLLHRCREERAQRGSLL
jgi:hypothetical protein